MTISSTVATAFVTGSLTLLAILPASISLVIHHYRLEYEKEYEDWDSIRWYRRAVWSLIICFWCILLGYVVSLSILFDLSMSNMASHTTALIVFISAGACLITVTFTVFTLMLFNRDYPYKTDPHPKIYFLHDRDNR